MGEKIFYVSLVRGLIGHYVKFMAASEDVVRRHVAEYFGRMWCHVYTDEELKELREKGRALVIVNDSPIYLGNEWRWE